MKEETHEEAAVRRAGFWNLLWFGLYVAWYGIAQRLMILRGDREEAQWLVLWMLPSLVIGGVVGLLHVKRPRRLTKILFIAATVWHLLTGLGLHAH